MNYRTNCYNFISIIQSEFQFQLSTVGRYTWYAFEQCFYNDLFASARIESELAARGAADLDKEEFGLADETGAVVSLEGIQHRGNGDATVSSVDVVPFAVGENHASEAIGGRVVGVGGCGNGAVVQREREGETGSRYHSGRRSGSEAPRLGYAEVRRGDL